MKKLRNNRGETLVEVLAAVLIAALSVTLLFGSVAATFTMDKDAQELDEAHYNAFSEAEAYTTEPDVTPIPGTVTISRVNEYGTVSASTAPSIEIYGGEDMYSYKRAGS